MKSTAFTMAGSTAPPSSNIAPIARTTVTFDVDNLFNTKGQRNRLFSFPSRANPTPSLNEFRERNSHVNFGLTLKRTFGGTAQVATPAAGATAT